MSEETLPAAADAPAPATDQQVAEQIASLWWIPLLRGVLLIAVGGYALLTPGVTLAAYMTILAIFVMLDGVLAIVAGVAGWTESRWWAIARGLIGVVAGLFVVAHPLLVGAVVMTTIVLILAIQAIIVGGIEIVTAIRERKEIEGEWWYVLGGVLSVVFGLILLANPLLSAALLVQVLGIFAILAGIVLIVVAFQVRRLGAA